MHPSRVKWLCEKETEDQPENGSLQKADFQKIKRTCGRSESELFCLFWVWLHRRGQYLSGRAVLNCGDDTATEVDHEVMILLHNSYEEAKRLIGSHREALDKIADYLIRRETITGKEFMKIFHAVERGIEIPENLDDLVIPEEKQNTVTLDKPEIQ